MYAWRPSPRLQGRLHPRAVIPKVRQKIQLSQVAFQSKFQGRSQNDVLVVSAGLPSVSRRHRHSHSHSHSAYSHPHDRQPRHSLSRIGFTQHHLQSRGCEAKSFSTKSASHLGKTKDGKSNTKNYNHNKSATTRGKKTQQQTKNKRAETNIKKPGNSPLSSEPPVAIAKCFELNSTEARLFRSLRRHIQREKLDCTLRVCGGWVRDKLLGKESDDIDIAVDNMPGIKFAKGFFQFIHREYNMAGDRDTRRSCVAIAANPDQSRHLETAKMQLYGLDIDVVNLRTEDYAEGSRIPSSTGHGSPEEDAMRRDFTINALFFNLSNATVEDWTGRGIQDLVLQRISTPSPPSSTFREDPLRALRAIRFAARYGYSVDPDVIAACRDPQVQRDIVHKVSDERVYKELTQIMTAQHLPLTHDVRYGGDSGDDGDGGRGGRGGRGGSDSEAGRQMRSTRNDGDIEGGSDRNDVQIPSGNTPVSSSVLVSPYQIVGVEDMRNTDDRKHAEELIHAYRQQATVMPPLSPLSPLPSPSLGFRYGFQLIDTMGLENIIFSSNPRKNNPQTKKKQKKGKMKRASGDGPNASTDTASGPCGGAGAREEGGAKAVNAVGLTAKTFQPHQWRMCLKYIDSAHRLLHCSHANRHRHDDSDNNKNDRSNGSSKSSKSSRSSRSNSHGNGNGYGNGNGNSDGNDKRSAADRDACEKSDHASTPVSGLHASISQHHLVLGCVGAAISEEAFGAQINGQQSTKRSLLFETLNRITVPNKLNAEICQIVHFANYLAQLLLQHSPLPAHAPPNTPSSHLDSLPSLASLPVPRGGVHKSDGDGGHPRNGMDDTPREGEVHNRALATLAGIFQVSRADAGLWSGVQDESDHGDEGTAEDDIRAFEQYRLATQALQSLNQEHLSCAVYIAATKYLHALGARAGTCDANSATATATATATAEDRDAVAYCKGYSRTKDDKDSCNDNDDDEDGDNQSVNQPDSDDVDADNAASIADDADSDSIFMKQTSLLRLHHRITALIAASPAYNILTQKQALDGVNGRFVMQRLPLLQKSFTGKAIELMRVWLSRHPQHSAEEAADWLEVHLLQHAVAASAPADAGGRVERVEGSSAARRGADSAKTLEAFDRVSFRKVE